MSTLNNDQWQEALVQLANNGITVAPASDVQATGTISADQGAVSVTFGTGVASWSVEATGTFSAGTTLFFEFQMTGSGAWYSAFGVPIGSTADVAVSSVVGGASITYQGNAAGFQAFRVRAHPFAGGDSVTVKMVGSVATDGGFVSKSLPPGTNLIGGVNLQQIGGVAAQMSGSDGLTSANISAEVPYLFNGTTSDQQRSNQDTIALLASAARTTTQTVADQTNYNARGVIVCVDTTVVPGSAPSNVVTISGKDPVSGKYNTLLTGAAITAVGTVFYTIYPGATAAANLTVSQPLPRTWQVKITSGNANSATYSVGAMYIV